VTDADDDNDFGEAPRTQMLSGDDIELLDDPGVSVEEAEALEALAPPHKPPTVPPRPPPVEPPPPSVLELAIAEAQKHDWRAVAETLRAELDAEGDKQRAALLAYELGEIVERRLREEPQAVKAYGRALQADPSLRPNLWAIRRVFYRRGLWPNLLKLIDAEVRFARSDRERADLLVERALVLEDRMSDPAGAREALERALALDATHTVALLHRERTALADGDQGTLARVWRALADAVVSPVRKVEYLVDLARLAASQGGDGLDEALEILSEAAALGEGRDRVLTERLRLAEVAGDPDAELAALEARVRVLDERFGPAGVGPAEPDEPRWPLDRAGQTRLQIAALRRRQARICRERQAWDQAWKYLTQALEVAPAEPILGFDLADVAEASGRFAELAEVTAGLAARETDPGRAAAFRLRRAEALLRAGEEDLAEQALAELAAAHPGLLSLVERRERAAYSRADFAALAALRLEEGAAAAAGTAFGPAAAIPPSPAWAAAAYVSAGDLYAFLADRQDDALAAYERALAVVPADPAAIEGLVALHERGGRSAEAVALLDREAHSVAPGGGRAEELLERIAAEKTASGDLTGALDAFDALAARRPDDLGIAARRERLLGLLGRHAERAALLEEIAGQIQDPASRAALQHEIGRLADVELRDTEAAAAAYEAALAADPEDRLSRAALAALHRREGNWDALADARQREARAASGDAARAPLYAAAVLLERRLGRLPEAAELYRELAARFPDDAFALRGLARTSVGDPAAQADALERETPLLPPGPAAGQGLIRLGDALVAAGRGADAADAYRRAHAEATGASGGDADPSLASHALWSLYALAARAGDPALLQEAAQGLADRTRDDTLRLDLVEDLAWLGDDADAAAARFDEVAAKAPTRSSAQLGRALAAARARDRVALADALVAEAGQTSDARVGAALLLRAATVKEITGDEGAEALAAEALRRLPDDPGVVVAAAERQGIPAAVRESLLSARARLAADGELVAELLVEEGVLATERGAHGRAAALATDVLRAQPGHLGALELLRRAAQAGGDAETACRAALALGRSHRSPRHAATFVADAAGLLEGTLARTADAALAWREAYLLDPSLPGAWERAHALTREVGDVAALYHLCGRRLEELSARPDAPAASFVPILLERAQLAQRHGDDDAAAVDLEALLERDPDHREGLVLLAEVRKEQGQAAEAARLLGRYHDLVEEPELRAASELRLATILAEDLGDLEGAVRALEVVMTVRHEDIGVRERLIELYGQVGLPTRAAEELERLVQLRRTAGEKARDELRAARTWRDAARDPGRAKRALERAAELDPLDLDIIRERVAISSGSERAGALYQAATDLRAAIAETPTEPSLMERLLVVGELGEDGQLTFAAQGALVGLGAASPEVKRKHAARRQDLGAPRLMRGLSDQDWTTKIEHPQARSLLGELWQTVAESAAPGQDPAQLGFTKGDRVAQKAMAQRAPAVDAVARAFGLAELEVWISPSRPGFARALAREVPVVLLGEDVAKGAGAEARLALARAVAYARTRGGPLEDLPPAEVTLYLAAALKSAGVDPGRLFMVGAIPGPKLDERARAVAKSMSRKDKKALQAIVERLPPGGQSLNVDGWRIGARATAYRAALLVGGDVHTAALAAGGGRGGTLAADPVAVDLIAWGVGEACLSLRHDLGLS
jgi:tetratricopeptide (TPR) repeat protein